MTIYIAGPMTGYENYNFDRFNAKAAELTKKGHRVLNPADIPIMPEYHMYWPVNKAMLDGSDAIYMLDGWEDSTGARKELYYAVDNSIPVLFESVASVSKLLDHRMHSIGISELPDCNTCNKKNSCAHTPRPGEYVRINCFLYEDRP